MARLYATDGPSILETYINPGLARAGALPMRAPIVAMQVQFRAVSPFAMSAFLVTPRTCTRLNFGFDVMRDPRMSADVFLSEIAEARRSVYAYHYSRCWC